MRNSGSPVLQSHPARTTSADIKFSTLMMLLPATIGINKEESSVLRRRRWLIPVQGWSAATTCKGSVIGEPLQGSNLFLFAFPGLERSDNPGLSIEFRTTL